MPLKKRIIPWILLRERLLLLVAHRLIALNQISFNIKAFTIIRYSQNGNVGTALPRNTRPFFVVLNSGSKFSTLADI